MTEKESKKFRKMIKRFDQQMKFDARQFFVSMLQQPFKQRLKLAWQIIKGDKG